jgi:hypothetical protein
MNLPSFTRSALATGLFSGLLALSATAAKTPPYLSIVPTVYDLSPVRSAGVTHSNGNVIVAGGFSTTGSKVTDKVQAIDLAKPSVSTLAPLPTARAGLGLVEFFLGVNNVQNELFAIGGIDGSGNVLSTVEIYNEATNTWSEGASMPTPRAFLSVVAATDGNIYAIGGTDGSGKSVSTVEKYDPTTNTWSTGPSLNVARSHFGAVLGPDSVLLVAGGIDASGNYLNSSEVFNVGGSTSWTVGVPMNVARSDFAFVTGSDGYLHAAGGRSGSRDLDSIEGYNPATAVWTIEQKTLKQAEAELSGTEGLNGNDYFVGGISGSRFITRTFKGVPISAASHTMTFFLHAYDEPYINGTYAMDDQYPFNGEGLDLGLLSTTSWTTFPAVNGTVGAAGTVTVNIPTTVAVGVLTTFTLYSADLTGGSKVQLGQTSALIGLGLLDTVQIPITTPVTFKHQSLVLEISTVLGLSLNLSGGAINLQISNLTGLPSD